MATCQDASIAPLKTDEMVNLTLNSAQKSWHGAVRDILAPRSAIYLLALGLVALAFILRTLLAPTLGEQALYLFLVPPVLVAGVAGGWGPGLLATTVSLVLHLYATGEFANLANPRSPLFAAELSRALTFALLGV